MDAAALPATIDDAELAGWHGVEIHTDCCRRGTTIVPLAMLRARQRYRRLDEIAARLVCEHCRRPPASAALWRLTPVGDGRASRSDTLALPTYAPSRGGPGGGSGADFSGR